MNTRDLEYFIKLVEYKNYTRVAKEFSVSQPSITQAIQRLEKEFNTQLVKQDRTHQKTVITRTGLLLNKNAILIDNYLKLTHREIDNANNKKIRLGLPPIIGTLYFPQVAGKLMQAGLLKMTEVVESGSDELLKMLRKGDVDVALLGSVRPMGFSEIDSVQLGSRPFVIIASPDNPVATKQQISFKELGNQSFVNLSGRFVHPVAFQAYCEYANINPQIVYESTDIAWVKSLVKANLGISLIVKDAVHPEDVLKSLEITDPVPVSFNISAAIRSGYVLSETEEKFLAIIKEMKI